MGNEKSIGYRGRYIRPCQRLQNQFTKQTKIESIKMIENVYRKIQAFYSSCIV